MEFFKITRDFPFMKHGKITTTLSFLIFIVAVFLLIFKGLNLSVEFTGGTVVEIKYEQSADLEKIRNRLENFKAGGLQVQSLGTSRDVMIRLQNQDNISAETLSDKVLAELKIDDPTVQLKKVEFIGPQVGSELVSHGLLAVFFVCLGMIAYLAFRFEWRFAVSGVLANLHDVVIILGFFSLFQWEFSLTVLAGVLAVLGYSVNEAVVIFDRIRENFRNPEMRDKPLTSVVDNAITSTMSRTVITHGSTEIMVLSMFIFGGEALHGFSLALTIGIVFGVYSSIFVGSPILLLLGLKREHIIKRTKNKEEAVV